MAMFYLADLSHKTVKGDVVVEKNVLHFQMEKAGFDSKATKDHVKRFPGEFEVFKRHHPDFVLPASFSDEQVGAGSFAVVAPPVVEPVVEEAAPVVGE